MTGFGKKMQNKDGSSMILALALLLICVMVSAVIVTTASSGLSRNRYRISQQQNYLAVTSAADYIVKSFNISTDKFVGEEISGKKPCWQYIEEDYTFSNDPTTVEENDAITVKLLQNSVYPSQDTIYLYLMDELCEETGKQKSVKEVAFSGVFSELMGTASENIYRGASIYTEKIKLSVANIGGALDERVPEVVCDFTMNEDYSIQMRVTSTDEDNEYAILIDIPAEIIIDDTKTQLVECSHEHKLYEVRKAANGASVEYRTTYEKLLPYEIQNTTEVTVTWGVPVVSKEVIKP